MFTMFVIFLQVVGAVGFRNQRLEIPMDVDPQWASMIESCWQRWVIPSMLVITVLVGLFFFYYYDFYI